MRLLDLWNFQCREIDEARLQSGEDDRLGPRSAVLANAEKIYGAAMKRFRPCFMKAALPLRPVCALPRSR